MSTAEARSPTRTLGRWPAWLVSRPVTCVVAVFVVAAIVGIGWGLPGSESWAADAMSPRASGLGAIAETYIPGHFFRYPPLHLLILTILSLPWILAGVLRAPAGDEQPLLTLIEPGTMTPIEVVARIVAVVMAAGIVLNTARLWARIGGPRAAVGAAIAVAANAPLVYYAHTGNLDVPYLFWSTAALVEIDRCMTGEAREVRALALVAAAVLTKDQAAGIFIAVIPFALVVVPLVGRAGGASVRSVLTRRALIKGAIVATVLYVVVAGIVVNPHGFVRRLGVLFGPASQDWATYPKGLAGIPPMARAMVASVPKLTSWPLAAAAAASLLAVVLRERGRERLRLLVPAIGAASFTLFFTIAARRTEERFLLPQSVLLLPYAGLALARATSLRTPLARAVGWAVAAMALVPAVLGVASMDATLVADARYSAEELLRALPPGTRVELYGGPKFFPRIPSSLAAVRVGTDPIGDRSHLAGVAELVDPDMDVRHRLPDVIVLSAEFSREHMAAPETDVRFGAHAYADRASRRFFHELTTDRLGYVRALRATCWVPWPLACREIHESTAGEIWIYRRAVP